MKITFKCLLLFSLCLSIYGCGKLGFYSFEPVKDVRFNITAKSHEFKPEHKSIFLYCDLEIENNSSKLYYFDLGMLKVKLNREVSQFTYYASLASVLPEMKKLNKGKSFYKIYFVFSEDLDMSEIHDFELINSGITENQQENRG